MELRHLRYFVAVAEEGNISRAAGRLHLTQPALSRQIKALEDEIGLQLLDRRANSMQLTEVGQTLLREAREVLTRADLALQRVRSAGQRPHLRVGYAPSLTAELLPSAMERFVQIHPRVKVQLYDQSSAEMAEGLQKGALDIILTVISETNKAISWTPLCQQELRLMLNRHHPLARATEVSPQQLHRQPLVLFSQEDYPEYWQQMSAWFKSQQIDAKVAGEYDSFCSLAAAVAAGIGAALVVVTRNLQTGNLLLKPLKPSPKPISIGVGRLAAKENDAIVNVFVEELITSAKEARTVLLHEDPLAAKPRREKSVA